MFSALGTEPRLRIVRLLLAAHPDGLVVGEIQAEPGIPGSTLSHHLDKLKNDELVNVRAREGTSSGTAPTPRRLQELLGFLYAECCTRNKAVEPQAVAADLQVKETEHEHRKREGRRQGEVRPGGAPRAKAGAAVPAAAAPRRSRPAAIRSPRTSTTRRRTAKLPELALKASLGCGNPTALAELKPGETVLDLGSGGGIDVLLSARRVGPTGKAYGLDMTDEMLALAEENKRKSGLTTSSSSKARSSTSRCPTTRWTSSSPTASSTSRATRTACCGSLPRAQARRPLRRLRRRGARRRARRRSARAWSCGSAASPAR